ncbi:hypothetical protein BCR33DRAFT_739349 [Rhizoclosmatium globosum]|uniref:Uncharacterized protein n=1 Tax=Rhizoclosmatium globosum TaxID=329046 RepID=A0A1Y2C5N1_9FUNG|nr:hypothetical protein BCR33DRAFT_739349 [Rhizoclosmatium globosum]|eukprot:ORY42352.1 hypothetical protein BCR33DRAFT_739349 [Rhizoclosmatium globosum]
MPTPTTPTQLTQLTQHKWLLISAATVVAVAASAIVLIQLTSSKKARTTRPKPLPQRRRLDIDIDFGELNNQSSDANNQQGLPQTTTTTTSSSTTLQTTSDTRRGSSHSPFSLKSDSAASSANPLAMPDMARQMTQTIEKASINLPASLAALDDPSQAPPVLNPVLVRAIVEKLLELPPAEAPTSAFSHSIAGVSGKPAVGSGATVSIRSSTSLPPFHAQIAHIVSELKSAKQRGRLVLIEGPPGLGKGTALRQYISDEGSQRPAIYLQLSHVLRKKHGASSLDEDEDDEEQSVTAFTETDTEMEGEEKVLMTVRRDAWIQAVKTSLGFVQPTTDDENDELAMPEQDSNENYSAPMTSNNSRHSSLLQRQLGTTRTTAPQSDVDMRAFHHISQALRLIAARCKAGPVMLIIDDIQLLFKERNALTDKYDGIPEVFDWLLRCEVEGILDVTFCSSEKSAVGAIKRLRGYDWAIKLHAVESVEDDVVISYLLNEVNPHIKEPARQFTEETAALFVATFDGSLLELDNYFRDTYSNVHTFITKRERSFLRRLQRHLPSRIRRSQQQPNQTSTRTSISSSTAVSDYLNSYTYQAPQLSTEEELRELFLDILMRGGVLPVAQLSLAKMSLVESLVERNILRWRDSRIRGREGRERRKVEGGYVEKAVRERMSAGSVAAGSAGSSPAPAGGKARARVLGDVKRDAWFGLSPAQQAMSAPNWGDDSAEDVAAEEEFGAESVVNAPAIEDDWSIGGANSGSLIGDEPGVVSDFNVSPTSYKSPPTTALELDNQWAGAATTSSGDGRITERMVKDMDAAEQLALFAMEDAELVWSNHLVRNVCESFVSGVQWEK